MGLLSNPALTQRNKMGRNLAKHMRKICLLFYVAGIAWFVCLAHPDFHHSTYLSENALSPGLVYPEVKQETSRLAQSMLEELQRERETHKSTTPYAWILAKMKQIGLETHVHNFTLNYPFGGGKVFHGRNIYGIMRAARIGSTEGIVFSAPYRAPNSVHTDITASVPLLLAFADFVRKKNYWAKDVIFLVTEQEQLGMRAWLEAYHTGDSASHTAILNSGSVPARAGALQAAINLEIQDLDVDYIDVKLEGLNGQLPNLDMFNLVHRITAREGILSGYKQKPRRKRHQDTLEHNLRNMAAMLATQATGVPNGNHGLYHRYRIEAVTLEAVRQRTTTSTHSNNRLALLKTLEGISRSLNNLLERFHQSYFFYILVQNDRFVSIGDFMPCIMLLASGMFIKAFLLWLTLDDAAETEEDDDAVVSQAEPVLDVAEDFAETNNALPYRQVLLYFGAVALLGLLCHFVPMSETLNDYMAMQKITTPHSICALLLCCALLGASMPLLFRLPVGGLELLHIGTLIGFGVLLIVLGLLNFALGFFVAVAATPLAIMLNCGKTSNAVVCLVSRVYAVLLHPMCVVYGIVWLLTLQQFPELSLGGVCAQALSASMDAVTFGLMDALIYGNWLYALITAVLLPLWLLLWTLVLALRRPEQLDPKLKTQ